MTANKIPFVTPFFASSFSFLPSLRLVSCLDFKYQDGEYNEYYIAVAGDGQVTVKLTKHGYQPTYQRIYVETTGGRFEFDYDPASESYQLAE